MIAPIPGWPGYYVTDCGRVVSFWTQRFRGRLGSVSEIGEDGKQLRDFDRKDRRGKLTGYRSVCLVAKGGIRRNRYVHDLVLISFVGPRPSPDHEVLHGNGERADNRLENLRWGTVIENAADRDAHGRTYRGDEWWWRMRKLAPSVPVLDTAGVEELAIGGCFDDLIGASP